MPHGPTLIKNVIFIAEENAKSSMDVDVGSVSVYTENEIIVCHLLHSWLEALFEIDCIPGLPGMPNNEYLMYLIYTITGRTDQTSKSNPATIFHHK